MPIVLISASAGYGKSILAAQWASACRRPVAWVNLDRGDNNPLVLLNYLAHALDRLAPVAPELFDELSSPAPRVDDVVLPLLAAELAHRSPFELILDDFETLTQPSALALVEFLLEEIPPGSQVALVTRVAPDLPLTRRRIAGDVLEIRADRLALDSDETRTLAASNGSSMSDWSLAIIRERTEGWPAGIELALKAAGEHASGDAVAEGLRGTHRQIADYLIETVLDRETEEHRTFLLATSVLRRMTAPLCDAVLKATGSSNALKELEQANSFVIPLDDERGWYRYHHLFGQLLRSELDRRHPGRAAVYLARAAEWHEQDGTDPEEAFRCAHECGDLERAGRIAMASAVGFVGSGQVESMRLWLEDCTDDEIGTDPQLAIAASWVCMLMGEGEKAERFLLDAERGNLDVPSADGTTSLRSSLANVRSTLGPRGIHQMLADAEFMYAAESAQKTRWVSASCRAIGTANVMLGRPVAAVAAFQEALMLYNPGRPELSLARVLCLGYLAFAAADMGAWPDARKWAQEAKALVPEHRLDQTLAAAIACTARATTLVHDGDSDRAAHELAHARRVRRLAHGMRWLSADLDLRWGNLSLDIGERLVAKEHAVAARAVLKGYPDPATLSSRLEELETRIANAADLHLTPAELRVIPFLPTHLPVKEIAAQLHLSPATVKTHLSQIYAKLDVSSRSEAVEKMDTLGLERIDTSETRGGSEQEQSVDEQHAAQDGDRVGH
ncbi:MAG: LuxR C-terminal-related transcriptional regulator [Gaiellaceae bacterium]